MRRLAKFTFEIEDVELDLVQSHIQDVALLTATNIEDWNYRFIKDRRNVRGVDLICFTHPTSKAPAVPVSHFIKVPVMPEGK